MGGRGTSGTVTNTATRKTQTYYDTLEEASAIDNRSSIRYANVKANTDLEYVLDGNNVKENIIVKAAATSYVYQFTLTLTGLTPTLYPSGAIGLCDSKTGERQYVIPAPFMYDADGALSEDVAYTLTPTTARGTYTLTVTADPDWINAEGRAFPVTIDPSIYLESPSADTYVSSEFPEACSGSGTSLSISSVDTVYVKFALPVLPVGASINTATLGLPVWQTMSVGSVSVSAHRVLSSWDEYTMSYDSKAGYSSTVLGTATVSATDDPDDPEGVVVTGAVTAWLSGSPNYGIALVGDSYYYDDAVVLQSRELAVVEDYPPTGAKLVVSYNATLPEGVYAFRNLYHDTDMWMTVENESFVAGAYLQQTDSSPFTATGFDNASFFKISHASDEYGTYIIRSMLNNNLTLSINSSGGVVTKEIPSNDADVESSDTFYIDWSEDYGGYVISPYSAPYLCLGVDPDYGSYINTDYSDGTIYWEMSQYTGNGVYGMRIMPVDNRFWTVGRTYTVSLSVWSTVPGANIPMMRISSGSSSLATGTWNAATNSFAIQTHDDGTLVVEREIRNATQAVYSNTYSFTISLRVAEGTYFFQNKEVGKYMQIDNNAAPGYSTSGNIMELWDFDVGDYQKWNLIHLIDGYYKIISVKSGMALCVSNDSINTNEAALIQEPYSDLDRQKWKITVSSSGDYILRPKSSEGYETDWCMCAGDQFLGITDGLNVEQKAYTNDSDYKDEWTLTAWPHTVQLEPQQQTKWCWAASARMSSMIYMQSSISQASAAVYVKLDVITSNPTATQITSANNPGSVSETEKALEYILNLNNCYSTWGNIYSESTLREILDSTNPVIIFRGWYDASGTRTSGHCVVIHDYYWDSNNNVYMYEIFDPWPQNVGDTYSRSYQSICNGRNPAFNGDIMDTGVWEGIIVYENGDYLNTITWPEP